MRSTKNTPDKNTSPPFKTKRIYYLKDEENKTNPEMWAVIAIGFPMTAYKFSWKHESFTMVKLYYGKDGEKLANKLTSKLNEAWKDFFYVPIVDKKTIQEIREIANYQPKNRRFYG